MTDEPEPTCPCGNALPEETAPTRTVIASTVGLTGGGGDTEFCIQCTDEQQHLYALFHGREKFSFCGCGCPEDAYDLIRNILQLCPLYENWESGTSNGAKVQEILGGIDGTFYLVLYAIDSLDLIEHGGSIGGSWLTQKGEYYLPLMRKHKWDDIEEVGFPHDGEECPADCVHWVGAYREYQRNAILEARTQRAADPHEPIPSSDRRCGCSRTPREGWNVEEVTGRLAEKSAPGREVRLWLHSDCPHHGGIVRQIRKGR